MDLKDLTPEQRAELLKDLEAEQKTAAKQKDNERKNYKILEGVTVDKAFPSLEAVSSLLSKAKKDCYDDFKTIIDLKKELYNVKDDQKTYTFRSTNGNNRIKLGIRTLDKYDDTAEAGIEKIKQYLESLLTDKSQKVISIINSLLKKDDKGNLKASRVLDLQKLAKELDSDLFTDGVEIISAAHYIEDTANFIQAEYKDENNKWNAIGLSITSVDFAE